jgi:hypothetical protein
MLVYSCKALIACSSGRVLLLRLRVAGTGSRTACVGRGGRNGANRDYISLTPQGSLGCMCNPGSYARLLHTFCDALRCPCRNYFGTLLNRRQHTWRWRRGGCGTVRLSTDGSVFALRSGSADLRLDVQPAPVARRRARCGVQIWIAASAAACDSDTLRGCGAPGCTQDGWPHSRTAVALPAASQGASPNVSREEPDEGCLVLPVEAGRGGIQSLEWVESTLRSDADGDKAHAFYIVRPAPLVPPTLTPRSRL